MNQIVLRKAYSDLKALKKDVSRGYEVKEKHVREYNSILDLLAQASGYNLDSFRVPESELHQKPPTLSIDASMEKSELHYSPDLYCDRAVLMKKLGPILTFFTITSTQGIPHVEFKLPN